MFENGENGRAQSNAHVAYRISAMYIVDGLYRHFSVFRSLSLSCVRFLFTRGESGNGSLHCRKTSTQALFGQYIFGADSADDSFARLVRITEFHFTHKIDGYNVCLFGHVCVSFCYCYAASSLFVVAVVVILVVSS